MIIGFLFSCSTEERDPIDPRFPQYSESGINAAACIYNDVDVWRDLCTVGWFYGDCQDLRIHYDDEKLETIIKISGGLIEAGNKVEIEFVLNNKVVQNYNDLKTLEGTVIVLDDNSGKAVLKMNNQDTEDGQLICNTGVIHSYGQLHIRNVRKVFTSEGIERYIISGTFGFDLTSPCWTYELHKGRFDYTFSGFSAL